MADWRAVVICFHGDRSGIQAMEFAGSYETAKRIQRRWAEQGVGGIVEVWVDQEYGCMIRDESWESGQ